MTAKPQGLPANFYSTRGTRFSLNAKPISPSLNPRTHRVHRHLDLRPLAWRRLKAHARSSTKTSHRGRSPPGGHLNRKGCPRGWGGLCPERRRRVRVAFSRAGSGKPPALDEAANHSHPGKREQDRQSTDRRRLDRAVRREKADHLSRRRLKRRLPRLAACRKIARP